MNDLAQYRLSAAAERLAVSKYLLDSGYFNDSVGRSYYAIFSAIRALLAERRVDFKKHSAVISYFNREYVKTGLFDVKYSEYLRDAFNERNTADYSDFYIVAKKDAELQYLHASELLEAVKNFLKGNGQ
ncbi:MAG: HEPN domain-containing protein [Selenomonadaceae bacterium]|nr:HEPN domain-containing protein [Selenomonadaceae bacterium]